MVRLYNIFYLVILILLQLLVIGIVFHLIIIDYFVFFIYFKGISFIKQKKENSISPKSSNISITKNIDVDIEKYENEAKQMLSRMELTLKDLRQLNSESDPNKRFEVFS